MSITCGKCNRPLKDPKSIERGYGPDCWRKIKAAAADETAESEKDEKEEE
ncbi:MAG: hypothetical protein GX625_17355 [Clostridiaceae bacterium]|nr:hypothetical protein [Clostridiaceae bacterium]